MEELFVFFQEIKKLALGMKVTVSDLFDSGKLNKEDEMYISILLDKIMDLCSGESTRELRGIDVNSFINKTEELFSEILTSADLIKTKAIALRNATPYKKEFDLLKDQAIQIYRKIQLDFLKISETEVPISRRRFMREQKLKTIHVSK
jgi:hypothetical protein